MFSFDVNLVQKMAILLYDFIIFYLFIYVAIYNNCIL